MSSGWTSKDGSWVGTDSGNNSKRCFGNLDEILGGHKLGEGGGELTSLWDAFDS